MIVRKWRIWTNNIQKSSEKTDKFRPAMTAVTLMVVSSRNTRKPNISTGLLMKKCLQKVEEHTRESRLTTDLWCQMIDMADNIVIIQVRLISTDITALTPQTAAPSLYKERRRTKNAWIKKCLPYSQRCVLSFSGGISLSKVFDTDMLVFSMFLHASPSNFNTAVTTG